MSDTAPHRQPDTLRLKVGHLVRPEIQCIKAYSVPPATGLVKLDAMENPYTLPPEHREDWLDCLREIELNRYPAPDPEALKVRLAEFMSVPDGMSLLLGNGSDELIQLIALALARPEAVLLAPEPSFVMYRMIAEFVGMAYVGVPLNEDFELDIAAMLTAIEQHKPALVFLAYPNNPTGNLFHRSEVEEVIRASEGLVVLDEAYHPFASQSFMSELGRHDNLLVMRTLSKLGLAGIRLGTLAGAPAWLQEIDKLRLPYNVNVLTQATAMFAIEHAQVYAEQANAVRASRESLLAAMERLPIRRIFPSEANFLLFEVASGCADAVHQGLLDAGVLIKNLHGSHPALADCLRVTVGTEAENQRFLEVLAPLLGVGADSA